MTKEEILFLKSLVGPVCEDVSGYDLKEIFKLASRHGILPLCYENISKAPGFDCEKYNTLKTKIFSVVFSQTKRTANFRKIYQALLDANITPIVLKGIICRQLYGDLCDHRPSADEDIFVKKNEFFRARDVLINNGYIPKEEVSEESLEGKQEITFKSSNGLSIEVHLNIIGTENYLRRSMNNYFENAIDNPLKIEIDGQCFYTLNYTEHYIFLFYHLFKHFSTAGVGIRQMLDMFKFASVYKNEIRWDKVHDAIFRINTQKLYGDILEIGNQYMGFELENIFGKTHPENILEDVFSAGAYGNDSLERMGSKVKVMAAIETKGKSGRLKMLFPSVESMREHYTILHKFPYLLPFMWIVRIVRYVFRSKTGKTYDVLKSEQIADKKIKLLKDYEII